MPRRILAAVTPWTTLAGAFGAAFLALGVSISVTQMVDPDYWWHVSVGEWILDHRAVPHAQWIAWSSDRPDWMSPEWGGEVVMALLSRAFGVLGSVAFFAAVTVAFWLVFVSIVRLLLGRKATPAALGALVFVASLLGLVAWGPRLQMFTTLWSLLALRIALGYLVGGERRGIWLLPVVALLWANTHLGSLLLGPAVVGAVTVGDWLERGRVAGGSREASRRVAARRPPYRPYLVACLVAVVAMALNPYTVAAYVYPFQTALGPATQALVDEWQSPDFHLVALRPLQLFIAFGLAVVVPLGARRADLRGLLLAGGLLFMSLQSLRYLGQFGPIGVAALSPALVLGTERLARIVSRAAAGGRAAAGRTAGTAASPQPPARAYRVLVTATRAGLLVAAVAFAARIPYLAVDSAGQNRLTADRQPVAATAPLRGWLAAHPGVRLFNAYDWGGYLNRELGVQIGAYGVNEVYTAERLTDIVDVLTVDTDPAPRLAGWHVGVAVVHAGSRLDAWLGSEPGWRELYRDAVASVYVASGS